MIWYIINTRSISRYYSWINNDEYARYLYREATEIYSLRIRINEAYTFLSFMGGNNLDEIRVTDQYCASDANTINAAQEYAKEIWRSQ